MDNGKLTYLIEDKVNGTDEFEKIKLNNKRKHIYLRYT